MLGKLERLLDQSEGFEWNSGNELKSVAKHGVSNRESEEVFFNLPQVFFYDKKHSPKEHRFVILGVTNTSRTLTVIFTFRKRKIRIISARDQRKGKERISFNMKKEVA